jgi:hypothetical protein
MYSPQSARGRKLEPSCCGPSRPLRSSQRWACAVAMPHGHGRQRYVRDDPVAVCLERTAGPRIIGGVIKRKADVCPVPEHLLDTVQHGGPSSPKPDDCYSHVITFRLDASSLTAKERRLRDAGSEADLTGEAVARPCTGYEGGCSRLTGGMFRRPGRRQCCVLAYWREEAQRRLRAGLCGHVASGRRRRSVLCPIKGACGAV